MAQIMKFVCKSCGQETFKKVSEELLKRSEKLQKELSKNLEVWFVKSEFEEEEG